MEKNTIAVFDFDGTVTRRDTFMDFILKNCSFAEFVLMGIKSFPVFLLYVTKIISGDIAKEKIFSNFFKDMPESTFIRACQNYSLNKLPRIVKKQALQKIVWHKERGHRLVIVSASIKDWIKPWAENNGFEKVIATIPEVKDKILTGKFIGKNCNGREKVLRFLAEYPNKQNYLYVYGDSYKDQDIFDLADEKFYRKFYA